MSTIGRAAYVVGSSFLRRSAANTPRSRSPRVGSFFFFNDPATTEISPLSLHAALPILLASIPGDSLGRRGSLRWMAILYVVSAAGCAFAWNWSALVLFRFIGGLGIGGSSVLGPMYIAEISPARWRGRLVGCFQFNVVFGILLAYFSNYLVGTMGFGSAEWRWQPCIFALPALLFLAMLFGIPESPRWLVKQIGRAHV